jgi:hypothetical protein
MFKLLSNRRRRKVLVILRGCGGKKSISDLSEQIAAIENNVTVGEVTSGQRKRVYVGLYQCHLPKMDEAGVVEYDQDRGSVAPGPHIERACNYFVDTTAERDVSRFGTTAASLAAGFFVFVIVGGIQLNAVVVPLTTGLCTAIGLYVTSNIARTRFSNWE